MTWSWETIAACSLDSVALVEEDWVTLKGFLFAFSLLAISFSVLLYDKILVKATEICDHRVTLISVLVAILTSHGSLHSLCSLVVATLLTCLCIAEESLLRMTSLFSLAMEV